LACSRPEVVAHRGGSGGGHGWSVGGAAWRDVGGAVTPLWRLVCLPATEVLTATLLGASAGLRRSERQGGMERTGGPFGIRWPVGARCEEGARLRGGLGGRVAWGRAASRRGPGGSNVEGRAPARSGAGRRVGARATSRRPGIVSDWPCSSDKNSIFCN
jgi:hypothetical protein